MSEPADLRALGSSLVALGVALKGKDGAAILKDVGASLVPLGDAAVRVDLGDSSMSRWKTGPLRTQAVVKGMSVQVGPLGKQVGPWRVLESGRGNGAQGPGVSYDGTTKRNKNGTVKKARKRGRANGRTAGKNTWSDADAAMERVAPGLMEAGIVKVVERGIYG